MRYILVLLGLMFANVVQAMDCQTLPDCASLGYSKDDDPNCAENGYMYCPFDQDYKVCVQYNCETLGFTETDKTSWCADLIKCKGNEKMTLCQKPCVATDAQSLAELASSGKCKIVTMKNDIAIPENQSITLHAGTTIDGGGHTITVTRETSFTLLDDTKLKNMHINRKFFTKEEFRLISVQGNSFFEDISVLDEDKETENTTDIDSLCLIEGTLTMSGTLKFELENEKSHPIFWGSSTNPKSSKIVFENANIELITQDWPAHPFAYIGDVVAKNSEIQIKTNSYVVTGWQEGGQFELVNSKMIIVEETNKGLSWLREGKYTFKLGEGGYLDTNQIDLQADSGELHFMFAGTEEKPATLIIGKKYTGEKVTLDVQNTAAKLIYNGKTYTPTQTGTTVLKDVETSTNWTSAQ